MTDIERDEWLRFSVRLRVAGRVLGIFLVWGVILYLVSALPLLFTRDAVASQAQRLYGITPANLELMTLLYLTAIKSFLAGILFPLWLSVWFAGKWVKRQLAA